MVNPALPLNRLAVRYHFYCYTLRQGLPGHLLEPRSRTYSIISLYHRILHLSDSFGDLLPTEVNVVKPAVDSIKAAVHTSSGMYQWWERCKQIMLDRRNLWYHYYCSAWRQLSQDGVGRYLLGELRIAAPDQPIWPVYPQESSSAPWVWPLTPSALLPVRPPLGGPQVGQRRPPPPSQAGSSRRRHSDGRLRRSRRRHWPPG